MADLNDLSNFADDIKRLQQNKAFLRKVGRLLTNRIRLRTKLGRGAKAPTGDTFRPSHKLPALKQSTKQRRRRLNREGKLTGRGATPARSGVNRSGKTLGFMHFRVKGRELNIKLDPRGIKVQDHLVEINPDYEFFNLSRAEFKFLVSLIGKELEKIANRRLR